MTSEPESKEASLEAVTLKKGLLWQQWDRFFSRWKERFFILTRDYLACFKKGSKIGISEMGSFLYKVSLVDIEGLQWVDKKRDGAIALKVDQGQLLLWQSKGLDDWMFSLREAVNRSKGRRESLRKANTLIPQLSDGGLWRRHGLFLQHTLSDSHMQASLVHRDTFVELHGNYDGIRTLAERHPTPHSARRINRMSVLTDIDLSGETDTIFEPVKPALGPRLAPQCSSESYSSLVSLGRYCGNSHLQKPSPHSLQVSPALTQRSLYAQHVLSSPEIAPLADSKNSKSAMTTATSEFSFVHPELPITASPSSPSTNFSILQNCKQNFQHTQSHSYATNPVLHPCLQNISQKTELRPSSIHGQPSLTVDKIEFYRQPPDVVPISEERQDVKRSSHRHIRPYLHSKSDSLFNADRLPTSTEVVPESPVALR